MGVMTKAGVLAVLAAGVMVPASAAAPGHGRAAARSGDTVQQGADAWAAGNYARALAIWRPLATAGDADAQYDLAQAYRLGRGVAVDEKQARDWYLKAAQQDHPEAQANYGLMLFQTGDRVSALPWLDKAATRGDPRAQYVLGTALFNGDVFGKDWVRAYALMTRAAAAGLPQARTSLGEMDRYIPLQQRQQGTAFARDMERSVVLAKADEPAPGRLVRAQATSPAEKTPASRPGPGRSPPPVAVAAPATAAGGHAAIARPPVTLASRPGDRPASSSAIVAAGPVARRASAAPSAGAGGWRVQVGAFTDPAAAGAAWAGIAGKVPGLSLTSYLVRAGAITRLQAGPLSSRADAVRTCAQIAAAGHAGCFPVSAP